MKARMKLALLLFVVLLVWPPIHAGASKVLGFSSWRLFGWGMYAQPHPESFSHLYLVWLVDSPAVSDDVKLAYEDFERRWRGAATRSCLTVLVQDTGGALRKVATSDVCDDAALRRDHRYFRHFRSLRHLASLSRSIAPLVGAEGRSRALAILVRQRVFLRDSAAATEGDVFEIQGDDARYVGSLTRD